MTNKIKVLYIIDTLGSEKFKGGGAERSLIEIALANQGVESCFVTVYKGVYLAHLLEENGIYHKNLAINEKYGYKIAVKLILQIIKEIKPDLIHSTLMRSDIISRKLKKETGLPTINSIVNNSYSKDRFKMLSYTGKLKLWLVQLYNQYTSKNADWFISNSQTIKDAYVKSISLDPNQITVIYRGRSFEKFQNVDENTLSSTRNDLGINPDEKIYLNVSRLLNRKGQADLIEVFSEFVKINKKAKLFIAGEGDFRNELEQLIKSLKLEDNVTLLGRRNDIPELLNLSDYFVFPSYYEGLPGALIEAMMAGKMIICSDIPENQECVTSSEAIFFKKGNKSDMLEKLKFCENMKENDIQILQQNSIIRSKQLFDINSVCEQYNTVYHELIQKLKKNI